MLDAELAPKKENIFKRAFLSSLVRIHYETVFLYKLPIGFYVVLSSPLVAVLDDKSAPKYEQLVSTSIISFMPSLV